MVGRLSLLSLLLFFSACGDDAPPTSPPVEDAMAERRVPPSMERCREALPVDLIWVIDNSNSMEEEQVSLAQNFPLIIDILANPPDDNEDGMPDWPPLTDLRLAVVTTDLGVGENNVASCNASGDEGIFIRESRRDVPPCDGFSLTDASWLNFASGDSDSFNQGFSCLAQLGTDGCGMEQQLEAAYEAIATQMAPGGANAGFFRNDSVVSVTFVTDEDDCSTGDSSFFDPSPMATSELGPLSVRCAQNPDRLHPISRYVQLFRNLELDRRGDVLVSAITGVPNAYVRDPNNIDYQALLDSDDMQIRIDPENARRIIPACSFGGVGMAAPARRIVETVRPFAEGGNGLVQSICQPDLRPAMEAIGRSIAGRLCPAPI